MYQWQIQTLTHTVYLIHVSVRVCYVELVLLFYTVTVSQILQVCSKGFSNTRTLELIPFE